METFVSESEDTVHAVLWEMSRYSILTLFSYCYNIWPQQHTWHFSLYGLQFWFDLTWLIEYIVYMMQKQEFHKSNMFCDIFCNNEVFASSSPLCVTVSPTVAFVYKYYLLILWQKNLFFPINFLSNLWEMNQDPFIKKDLNIQMNAWLIFCLSPLPVSSY